MAEKTLSRVPDFAVSPRVDQVGIEERASRFTKRSIKNETKNKSKVSKPALLERLENYLSKNNLYVILGIMASALIFSLLMFDVKISIGHDDALYIQSAYEWSNNFTGYFYNATAPLYIMFLIIPIKIWGLNLILLKSFSILFFLR